MERCCSPASGGKPAGRSENAAALLSRKPCVEDGRTFESNSPNSLIRAHLPSGTGPAADDAVGEGACTGGRAVAGMLLFAVSGALGGCRASDARTVADAGCLGCHEGIGGGSG